MLNASQMKSEIVALLARKRDLVLQLVMLETRYDSLRSLLREEEGSEEADAFCRENYGIGEMHDADAELALAHMDLTFRPYTFPGLDSMDCYRNKNAECVSLDVVCKCVYTDTLIDVRVQTCRNSGSTVSSTFFFCSSSLVILLICDTTHFLHSQSPYLSFFFLSFCCCTMNPISILYFLL